MTDARSARCCSRFSHESLSCGVPFVIEEPLPRQGCDSVWLQQKQPRAGGSTWTFQAVSTFLLCPSLRGGGAPAPRPLSREPAVFATWRWPRAHFLRRWVLGEWAGASSREKHAKAWRGFARIPTILDPQLRARRARNSARGQQSGG